MQASSSLGVFPWSGAAKMSASIHSSLLPRLARAVKPSCLLTAQWTAKHSSSYRCAPSAGFGRRRGYATPRHTNSSPLLSQALDQKQRAREHDLRESIGPIPMGMARPNINHGEKVKKWNELSTGGKCTSNILLCMQHSTDYYLLYVV